MKKFMLDTKTALGLAPKTVDEEYDKKAAVVKSVESNITAYTHASSRMTSAVNTLISGMETMAKAFEDMANTEGTSDAAKKVAAENTAAVKKMKEEYEADFKKAMSKESDLKAKVSECKKVGTERGKIMGEYDTYREEVSKKEEKYKKENKDLSESKNYADAVKRRDEHQAKYEEVNTQYKTLADEIAAANNAYVSKCLCDYIAASSALLTAMQKELHTMEESAKPLAA